MKLNCVWKWLFSSCDRCEFLGSVIHLFQTIKQAAGAESVLSLMWWLERGRFTKTKEEIQGHFWHFLCKIIKQSHLVITSHFSDSFNSASISFSSSNMIFVLTQESNPDAPCCELAVLTTHPLCHPSWALRSHINLLSDPKVVPVKDI